MEVVVTTGAIGRAKLQSNHHHQQTNIQFCYRPDALPVAQPTVLKHWRENITSHELAYPKLGVFQLLSLTTNNSWLPWGRVAIILYSPKYLFTGMTDKRIVQVTILSFVFCLYLIIFSPESTSTLFLTQHWWHLPFSTEKIFPIVSPTFRDIMALSDFPGECKPCH